MPFLLWVSQFFALCLPGVWAHRLPAATAPGASPSEQGVVEWRRSKAGGQYPQSGFLPGLAACCHRPHAPGAFRTAHSPAGSFTRHPSFLPNCRPSPICDHFVEEKYGQEGPKGALVHCSPTVRVSCTFSPAGCPPPPPLDGGEQSRPAERGRRWTHGPAPRAAGH